MIRIISLVLALVATSSASFVPFLHRQAGPASPVGNFRLLFGNLREGLCPKTITHNVGPTNSKIPHAEITMNEQQCTGDGSLSILGKDALLDSIDENDIINTIEFFDDSIPGIIYGLERNGRDCGKTDRRLSAFSDGTVIMIFKPAEDISVNLVTFGAGRTFMITHDPAVGPCFFRMVPPTPTPAPTKEPLETPDGPVVPAEPDASPEMSPDVSPEIEDDGGEDDDGSVCFPADATVELENGTTKTMAEINLGDSVKVGDGQYSDVFMFTHKDARRTYSFVRISTESGAVLSATPGHYIYINGNLAAAKTVVVGDSLELAGGQTTTVTSVDRVRKVGLYNPQTLHGDIVVNTLKASTFTRTVNPPSAQALMAPLRHIYSIFGLSGSFLDKGADCIAPFVPHGNMVM